MSIATLQSLYEAAIAALEAGDYELAIRNALACKLRLATMPDMEGFAAGGGANRMQWANAAAIDGFIAECKSLSSSRGLVNNIGSANRPGPIQRTRIVYGRVTDGSSSLRYGDCYE